MRFHQWWEADPRERFWLEITDRTDLGIDLNAPKFGANSREQWHYSLIHEVSDGDVVFHYHKTRKGAAISAWSRASGAPWEDEVIWAPHAGERKDPEKQPGWRLSLQGFHPIDQPITFEDIRANEDIIRVLESELEDRYGSPLYTPFETGQRTIRPKQAYLTKFPADLLDAFPSLGVFSESEEAATEFGAPLAITSAELGEAYRRPDESVLVSEADPFSRDPALVERALRSHAATQNSLADFLMTHDTEPRSPKPMEPNYDLAWAAGGRTYVVEVKSLSATNEERQLRLALGQVLRYRQAIDEEGEIVAVVATSREPADPSWKVLLADLQVLLVWPDDFSAIAELHDNT